MGTPSGRGSKGLFALVLCIVLPAVLFLPLSPASSVEAQPSPSPPITPPTPAQPPELTPTEEKKVKEKCEKKDLEFVSESDSCSHGADPPPPGKNNLHDRLRPFNARGRRRLCGAGNQTVLVYGTFQISSHVRG
jgi:hypothetical protein